jgi:hypothetical protein
MLNHGNTCYLNAILQVCECLLCACMRVLGGSCCWACSALPQTVPASSWDGL